MANPFDSSLVGRRVKVYKDGGFAVGAVLVDRYVTGMGGVTSRTLVLNTKKDEKVMVDNPGLIFVSPEPEFPSITE